MIDPKLQYQKKTEEMLQNFEIDNGYSWARPIKLKKQQKNKH